MRLPRTKGLTMTMPDPQANSSDPQNVTPAPATDFGATSIPAPEAPSFPQAAAPGFDEATATPGATTYGTASDPAGAQAPYGAAPGAQPGYGDSTYAQPSYGQPAYAQTTYANPPKQWVLALVLAFFFGFLGVHNFYLGRPGRGIAQLILTITVIGAVISCTWAFIEFIMILMRAGSYGYDASGQPLV